MYSTIIDCNTLEKNLNDNNWVIVDCRYDLSDLSLGNKSYLSGHIPGAVFTDVLEDLSGPPVTDCGRHPMLTADAMRALFSSLGISNKKQVIVYDNANGCFAGRLWWMLQFMGHNSVAVLDGGWDFWKNGKFEIQTGLVKNTPGDFKGIPCLDWLVTVDKVARAELLIDSRDPARYRGESEPIDRVPGHIPGALNRFWKDNLTPSGQFKPSEQLQQEFNLLLANINPAKAVFYCGSGVTACHNLLALAHAGLNNAQLYAGSWSEWCSDPDRPIATKND